MDLLTSGQGFTRSTWLELGHLGETQPPKFVSPQVCESSLGRVLLVSDHERNSCSTSWLLERLIKSENYWCLEILKEITWKKKKKYLGSAALREVIL